MVHHLSRFRCKEDCDGSPGPGHHDDARVGNDGSGAGDVGVLHLVKDARGVGRADARQPTKMRHAGMSLVCSRNQAGGRVFV